MAYKCSIPMTTCENHINHFHLDASSLPLVFTEKNQYLFGYTIPKPLCEGIYELNRKNKKTLNT